MQIPERSGNVVEILLVTKKLQFQVIKHLKLYWTTVKEILAQGKDLKE